MENGEVENADNEALVNVQSGLSRAYYGKLVERAKANDRSARGEATRILKAVLDGNIQFVDPVPVVNSIMPIAAIPSGELDV